jgi:hypothetical protein
MPSSSAGSGTIEVFVGRWLPDATAIERKLHLKFPKDKHPLGAPQCWRAPGIGVNTKLKTNAVCRDRLHRVFFTYSTKMPVMLAAGCVKVDP